MHLCLTIFAVVLTIATRSSTAFTVVQRNHNRSTLLRFSIDDVESKALAASEAWDLHATSFFAPAQATVVQEQLGGRVDVECFRVGTNRARFVFTNPELGMDLTTAVNDNCVVLCVANAKSGQEPWPDIFQEIGVDLSNVGDVVSSIGGIYMMVTPEVADACTTLLPTVVIGAGVTVKPTGEPMPEDGELQDMEEKGLDKRAQYAQKGN